MTDPMRAAGVLLCAMAFAVGTTFATQAATNRALLIGVSGYGDRSNLAALYGPKNDVALVHDLLVEHQFVPARIQIVADGLARPDLASRALSPTRAHIVNALEALARNAVKGDFIVIYYAGHGAKLPLRDHSAERLREKPDGFDEIILPLDIGRWNDNAQSVDNALVDEDIGKLLSKIRAKGAFVWAIFDTCHSNTLTRDGSQSRVRAVSAEELGVPEARIAAARDAARSYRLAHPDLRAAASAPHPLVTASRSLQGGLVAYFASLQDEEATESPYSDGEQQHGDFTVALAGALRQAPPGATYRQLMSQIQSHLFARGLGFHPVAEGDDGTRADRLDVGVFAQAGTHPVPQWMLREDNGRFELNGGTLDGLDDGNILHVFARATDPDAGSIGTARIAHAGLLSSSFLSLPQGVKKGFFARLAGRSLRLSLRIAEPAMRPNPGASPAERDLDDIGYRAVSEIEHAPSGDFGFVPQWLKSGTAGADILLLVRHGRIWFLPADRSGVEEPTLGATNMPSIAVNDQTHTRERVVDTLKHIAAAMGFLRAAETLQPSALSQKVKVVGEFWADPSPHGGANGWECDRNLAANLKARHVRPEAIRPDQPLTAHDCDQLVVSIENGTSSKIQVQDLYMDQLYGLQPIHIPVVIPPRTSMQAASTVIFHTRDENGPTPSGYEHFFLVVVPYDPSRPLDLTWLKQDSLETRGGEEDENPFAALLHSVLFETQTRGSSSEVAPMNDAAIATYNITVLTKDRAN